MITIAYVNFWDQSQNSIQDWWLSEFVKHNIDCEIKIVNYQENPDILFASCFGNINIIKNINSKCKIFFYGENLDRYQPYNNIELLKNTFDIILGFKYDDIENKIVRLPLWVLYYPFYNYTDENNILKYIENSYKNNVNNPNKQNTASLVVNHDSNGIRTKIYDEMSKYVSVLCPSTFKHNVNKIGNSTKDKINFLVNTTYNICPENSEFEGYFTEKIFHALEAGCIPIYWAIDKPEKDIINEKCYCWIKNEENNFDETIFENKIKDVIENKTEYIKENIFTPLSKCIIDNMYKTLKNQIEIKLKLVNKQVIYGISYASREFINRINPITQQAEDFKLFDNFKCWKEEDIDDDFKNKYSKVWNNSSRGGGWWIWKPYIIYKQLEKMNNNDILIYIDSGCSINNTFQSKERFNNYIQILNNNWSGVLRFELTHPEYKYTNKYTVNYFKNKFNVNMDKYIESNQIVGGIILMRKTIFVMEFFKKVLEILNEEQYLFTDNFTTNNELHSHDQSIMSLLCKIMGGSIIIPDETYFDSGFNSSYSYNFPFWATRKR
jgi:hypothetical protein